MPDIEIREQRPELYVAIHHAIARAVDTVVPGATSRSIDELSVDLGPDDDPETVLRDVKGAIRQAVGSIVTVSCAVAPSAYLAKTAAEADKPDAAIVWRPEDLPAVYAGLALSDLPGLGPATEGRLRRSGIDTVRALHDAPRWVARRVWGSLIGEDVHKALRGRQMPVRRRHAQSCGSWSPARCTAARAKASRPKHSNSRSSARAHAPGPARPQSNARGTCGAQRRERALGRDRCEGREGRMPRSASPSRRPLSSSGLSLNPRRCPGASPGRGGREAESPRR